MNLSLSALLGSVVRLPVRARFVLAIRQPDRAQFAGAIRPARARARGATFLRSEAGLAAGAEALIFGVLIFVLGTIVVVNAWSLVDAKFAASAAAREAVRAVVDAPLDAELHPLATESALAAFAGHGRDPSFLDVSWHGDGPGPIQARCAEVRYRTTASVPILLIPRWSSRLSFDVSAVHTGLIDPFRSGLAASECEL